MSPTKGNPTLQVRLDPQIHDELAKKAAGQSGGASHFVRRLICRELEMQTLEPLEMGSLRRLQAKVKSKELWADPQEVDKVSCEVIGFALSATDSIAQNLAFQILGQLVCERDRRKLPDGHEKS